MQLTRCNGASESLHGPSNVTTSAIASTAQCYEDVNLMYVFSPSKDVQGKPYFLCAKPRLNICISAFVEIRQ